MRVGVEKPPATQRSFLSEWGELDYLRCKVRYWLHVRGERMNAERYRERLRQVLRSLPGRHEDDIAIIRSEGLALLAELDNDIDAAISFMTRVIELIELLHWEASQPNTSAKSRAFMLQAFGRRDLNERRSVLKSLQAAKVLSQ